MNVQINDLKKQSLSLSFNSILILVKGFTQTNNELNKRHYQPTKWVNGKLKTYLVGTEALDYSHESLFYNFLN
ncbi:hypothetical protein D1013_02620 [Euzebyella marina]|uniref:Uncharacterized protein n=1 Tax=Euzebyella marina TaxID=1761453 RepID=A0A3G2L286_9FLAO|nr:hypothetical protein D1013_02620 [Euzebyella marina]